MNADSQSAREDLAFLRTLVGDDEAAQTRSFGETYFAAGLIYGCQMLLHAAQFFGAIPYGLLGLAVSLGPTLVFIPVLLWIIYRNRKQAVRGTVSRAIGAAFGAVGLANLFLIAVVGSVALEQRSVTVWLIYPCTVFVLQGMAWLFAFMMRRRGWYAPIAAGWFASAVAMALTVNNLAYFILFAGIGLWFCMALPGWVMLRNAKSAG